MTLIDQHCPVHKTLLGKLGRDSVADLFCKKCKRSYIFDTREVGKPTLAQVRP